MKAISLVALGLLVAIQPCASLAEATSNLTGKVISRNGTPEAGATVTATSDSGLSFATTTDGSGRFVIARIPTGTYTITATRFGYGIVTLTGVTVFPDQTQTLTLQFGPTPMPSEAPPPPPPPPPTAPPRPTPRPHASPGPPLTSLLVGYNKAVPDHRAGATYYGRYSYVLLNNGNARSHALIDALSSTSHAVSGSPMVPSALKETWKYNLFLMPVWPPMYRLRNASTSEFVSHYDFNTSSNLRQHYCDMPSHAHWSLCAADRNGGLDEGPIILVFPNPVSSIVLSKPWPKAIALDLTGVPESQFPHVIGQLKSAMRVQIDHDSLVPLSWADTHVARWILGLATVLQDLIGQRKVYFG